jgi:hypothetical protein
MQSTADFKAYLESRGFTLRADGDALFVEPRKELTVDDVARIRAEKPALLALLAAPVEVGALPYFNEQGDLVISADTDRQFKYWLDGAQTIWQTLVDLSADAATVRRYAMRLDALVCHHEAVAMDGLLLCVECGHFTEAPVVNELERVLGF